MSGRIPVMLLFALSAAVTTVAEEPAQPKAEKPASRKAAEPAQPKKNVQKIQVKKIKVVTAQAAAKLREAQQAAINKLNEARQAAAEAQKTLAEAEQAAASETDPQAKQAAAKRVDEAKQKLDEANKEVQKRLDEARQAAAQAAQIAIQNRRYNYGNVTGVRDEVDPQDSQERFLLLTPGGPVVVEVDITLDGKPFRVAREELIDEMLAAVDKDQDGQAAWEEAMDNSRFTMGRIRLTNEQQRKQFVAGFDKNKNQAVDRAEARRFVAQYFGGPAFTLSVGYSYGASFGGGLVAINGAIVSSRGGGQADVRALLDVDEDGILSKEEIAAAGERLKSKDADDNDLLYPAEIAGGSAPNNNRVIRTITRTTRRQVAVMLGPTATAESLFAVMGQHYQSEEGGILPASFSAVTGLFAKLDKNENGRLEQDEVLGLNDVKPHVELAVALGQSDGPKGIICKAATGTARRVVGRADAKPKASDNPAEAAGVELPGLKLDFRANLSPPATYNYDRTAQTYLTRYDANSNGYLERQELPAGLAQQFALWDDDSDGKVFPKEITALYVRQRAPYATQVRGSTASDGNSLFRALDLSGDGRLGLREMKTAHRQILTFDKDKDGRVSAEEIPETIAVSFAQGNTNSSRYVVLNRGNRNGANRPNTAGGDLPDWFTRMDRNGDGDVTQREFLGNEEQFKRLDTNGDGFIEPKEAIAAEKARTPKPENKPEKQNAQSDKK